MLQTLGMPEAARHRSALLSLPPSHAACRSSDVAATLQQQQRLTGAIRAGTATLVLDEISPGSSNLSHDLSQWAKTSLTGQTLTVTLHSSQGTVCQWRIPCVSAVTCQPVFSYDDSRLGLCFTQASTAGDDFKVALVSLTQPLQQPVVVTTGASVAGSSYSYHRIAPAPSADLFLVGITQKVAAAETEQRSLFSLFSLNGDGSGLVQHQVPANCNPLGGDLQRLMSPDSSYLQLTSPHALHCLEIQTGLWHHLQQLRLYRASWLQLPACVAKLIVAHEDGFALISAPRLAIAHTQSPPIQTRPAPKLRYKLLDMGLVCYADSDFESVQIFKVLSDAPRGQPLLCLLSTLALSADCMSITPSPDSHLVCCGNGAKGLIMYDVQSASDIRLYTLPALSWVHGVTWHEQGLMIDCERFDDDRRLPRLARWVI